MSKITAIEAASILRSHNVWRRGEDNAGPMINPKRLGQAIDCAIEFIAQRDELLATLERVLLESLKDRNGAPSTIALMEAQSIIAKAKGGAA